MIKLKDRDLIDDLLLYGGATRRRNPVLDRRRWRDLGRRGVAVKMVMKLCDFAASLSPMLRRCTGRAATEDVRQDVEARIKQELVKHCVCDDARYRITDVAVSIETVGEGSRLAVEWI